MNIKTLMRLSVGAVALIATPALAQAIEPQIEAPEGGIKEIVVTAQKREESIQDTALSVSAVTGDEIQKAAQGSLDAVLKNMPGVELQGLAQGTQVYIRGVGSSIDPTFADPSIALMVDGGYNGRTEGVEGGAFDIARVEVLRGPQGTLYGRNASGGLVNVITADPVTDGFHGYARGQAGNYGLWRIEGALNAPLGESAALRVAGFREKRDGYVDDGSNDSDAWGLRAKLLIRADEWLRVVLKADVYRAKGFGTNTVPVPGSAGNLTFPPPFMFTNFNPYLAGQLNPAVCAGSPFVGCAPIARFPNGWVQRTPGNPWSNNREHPAGLIEREAETYAADIQADLGFATLTLLPSYTRSRNRLLSSFLFGSIIPGPSAAYVGCPAVVVPGPPCFAAAGGPTFNTAPYGNQDTTTKYKSVEARLTSNGSGPLKYVFGLYYLKSDPGGVQLPGSGFTLGGQAYTLNNTIEAGETLAGFGQITYSLTDRFRMTGGLRVSRDRSSQNYTITIGTGTAANTFKQSQSSTQYKLGLEYDLAEDSLLYAHVSTGFKQGGITATFPPISFLPERLTAFEIGSKNQFWDNRVQLNLAAFHYRYQNYQFSVFEDRPVINASGTTIATATFGVIHNAGPTNIDGFEASLELLPWQNGRITGAVTYLDAKYGTAVLPNNPFVNQGNFNLGGRQIQNAPSWSVNLGFEQGFRVGPGMLSFGAQTHLSTGYYTTPEQYLPGAYQAGFSRTDLNLRYEGDGGWSIGAWLKNVENNAQTTYVFPAYRRFITAPRTFVVTAGIKF